MRGGALPPALLFVALGFALSFVSRRTMGPAAILAIVLAVMMSFAPLPTHWTEGVFAGCWVGVILNAASVHLPRHFLRESLGGPVLAMILAANTGLWAGAVIAMAGSRLDVLKAVPWVVVCVPGYWLVNASRQIVIKVVASWLIAVSVLAGSLPMVPTPGYAPDHME